MAPMSRACVVTAMMWFKSRVISPNSTARGDERATGSAAWACEGPAGAAGGRGRGRAYRGSTEPAAGAGC